MGAVEIRGSGSGRIRMKVVESASNADLVGFVRANVAAGAAVHTDAWSGYLTLPEWGYDHRPRSQRTHLLAGGFPDQILPRMHRIFSHLKTWLVGTHHGVSGQHLQVYLDEFVFRFNRRRTPMATFQTLLGLESQQPPTTYLQIRSKST